MPGNYGQTGATTTAAAVGATTQVVQNAVVVRAVSIGTNSVAIGNNTAVTIGSGYILYGNDSVTIPVGFWKADSGGQTTMAGLYVISSTGTQTISWFDV